MPNILHFLNGDAPLPQFREAEIPGEVAVMREMFCRGDLTLYFDDQAYWDYRKSLFAQFHVSTEDYEKSITQELAKARDKYDEVVIWYEYDVYCHINMLFLVMWTKSINEDVKISLAYSPNGTGRNSSEELKDIFDRRHELSLENHAYLQSRFKALCDKKEFDAVDSSSHAFPNLQKALEAYRAQIWSDSPPIQKRIMALLDGGSKSGKEIIKTLLEEDDIYGYGDVQYMLVLNAMTDALSFSSIDSSTTDEYIDMTLNNEYQLK